MFHGQLTYNSIWNSSETILYEYSDYSLKNAFYANNSLYHIENTSKHFKEKSNSNMEIRGAATNNSKISVNGLVDIENSAPSSSGHQNIHALILDNTSIVSADPILEIKNNQVSCSHRCSITQVKDEMKFYMQSRGLSEKEIINLIVNSFTSEVLSHFKTQENLNYENDDLLQLNIQSKV
jgi:Fe-S cluster assembly scaffold protein SufB